MQKSAPESDATKNTTDKIHDRIKSSVKMGQMTAAVMHFVHKLEIPAAAKTVLPIMIAIRHIMKMLTIIKIQNTISATVS